MDGDIKFEDIYYNMDGQTEQNTKNLLNQSSSTDISQPLFCSNICNYLFYYCCFFLSE